MAGYQVPDIEVEPGSSALSSFILGPLCRADGDTDPADPLEGLLDGLYASRAGRRGSPQRARGADRADGARRALDDEAALTRSSQGASAARGDDLAGPRQGTEGEEAGHRDSALPGFGEPAMDEDMLVTSSASEPSFTADEPSFAAAPSVATAPSSPGRGSLPDGGAGEEQERARLVRILCALHALRPSELAFLLSGWQCDWLLLHDGLCPPSALALMLRLQSKRRLRRQHGGKHIGDCPGGEPVSKTASPAACHSLLMRRG
mmetsp:Transcript_73411/g.215248  ORF Transcript_73411/g.215248 Transcript_73411/m.215248 type:complete len:262 (+) Transcript_73411:68-853(+)